MKFESKFNKNNIILFFLSCLCLYLASSVVINIITSKLHSGDYLKYNNFFFYLSEVHNRGICINNIFENLVIPDSVIIGASLFAIFVIIFLVFYKSMVWNKFDILSLSSLCTGVTINMLERIHFGYVIDYFNFSFFRMFPTFNVADILICMGAFSFIVSLLAKKSDEI